MKEQECYFLPLCGTEQIGMNLNIFGFIDDQGNEQCIIVDAGVGLQKTLGISLTMSSIDSILDKNVIGIVCTHAHEDHIGAIPFIIKRFKKQIPIYATKFTMLMIQEKLTERNILDTDLRIVDMNSKFNLGCFNLEFVYITHSIPEPNMIIIKYGGLTLLHTGDWKLDHDPLVGPVTNEKRIAEIGAEGVDYLICDSTNSMEEVATGSESIVRDAMDKLIQKYKNRRVILSCFSSNVARIKSYSDIAKKYNKKVCFLGRSFKRIIGIAQKTGYLMDEPHIIQQEDLFKLTKEEMSKLMIMCTGSQGENKSVLHRVVYDLHNVLKIDKNDVVIFSARVIPGNENEIALIKNNLMARQVTVIDASDYDDIHVSGHPSQPELKRLFELAKPKHIIPVHGDRMHLVGLEQFARSLGFKSVLVPYNGAVIRITKQKPEILFKVNACIDGLDGKTLVNMGAQFLQTRMRIGENGCVFIVVVENDITIYSCGMLPGNIINDNKKDSYTNTVKHIVRTNLVNNDEQSVKNTASQVGLFLYERYGKSPIVIIHNQNKTQDINNYNIIHNEDNSIVY